MNTNQLQQFAADARHALMGAIEPRVREALDPASALYADNRTACEHLRNAAPSAADRKAFAAYVAQVTERYAYRWFNRIIAFRYMDVHGYTVTPVVSSADPKNVNSLPEILTAARRGEYDERVFGPAIRTNEAIRQRVEAILDGDVTTADPQGAAYGLLMAAACNYWHASLPFLFDEPNTIEGTIDVVLMPQNLLADGSPLREAIGVMTPEACGVGESSGNVEIIGWLYQFYIAPRKDEVMAGFKKGHKAGAAEIPAATQLFTPEWIVRYLVQNTVGRLWMQGHPDCTLAEQWEYYIAPTGDDQKAQSAIMSPEELTVCDPACGSGHMLTYAFDLLYEIYEDEGYARSEIPGLILEHNLFGMEIDERAAQLAAFALTMKARGRSRGFFRNPVLPHIEQIRKIKFSDEETTELNELYDVTLPTELWNTYADADVFGSLIQPDVMLASVADNIHEPEAPTLFDPDLIDRGNRVLEQTRYLSRTYAAVVGNPPYMGGKNMSAQLKQYVEAHYPKGKSDLFAAFMLRCMQLVPEHGYLGFMTPYVWMFIHTYEELRKHIIEHDHISSLIQLEYSGFDGATVPICTFVLQRGHNTKLGSYIRLSDFPGAQQQAPRTREIITAHRASQQNLPYEHAEMKEHFYEVDQQEFAQIPGSPIAYWVSHAILDLFTQFPEMNSHFKLREGIHSADNLQFLRRWYEVSFNRIIRDATSINDIDHKQNACWVPYCKGGEYRKWYGNNEFVIGFDLKHREMMKSQRGCVWPSQSLWFKEGGTWTAVSSGSLGVRYFPDGFLFDAGGQVVEGINVHKAIAELNSSLYEVIARLTMPTLNFKCGVISKLPDFSQSIDFDEELIGSCITTSKMDWDSSELSFDFHTPFIFTSKTGSLLDAIQDTENQYLQECRKQQLREISNNIKIVEQCCPEGDVSCDVPLERVSLKRNKAFAYPKASPEERDELFTLDLVKELISYAVGCMFGRYSLDKPGLILASQGETMDDFHTRVPYPSFEPDADNVIPMCEGDYFDDDIVVRFRRFIAVAFGAEHLEENIAYIEQVLGKPLRKYFVNDFYNDHVKMYSNRPIYWQYSSRTDNKGAFKALVYLHRYTPSTTSTVLAYLRDYIARVSGYAAMLDESEAAKDLREADRLRKIVTECKTYEDDVLYPLATRNMPIDLDDGVLVNYLRMGKAVRTITAIEKKRKDVETWTWPVHPLERQ